MAISLVQHTAGSFGSSGTVSSGTFPQNVTQGNLLIAALTSFNANVTNLVDNNGNSYTRIGSVANSLNDQANLWYCGSANAGSTIVTGTFSAVHARSLALYEYSGALKTGVLDTFGSASGTSTSVLAGTATTSVNNELVFYVGCDDVGTHNSVVSATGYNQRDVVDNSASFESLYTHDIVLATPGTTAGSFTITPSAGWAAVGAVFKPLGGAGTTLIQSSGTAALGLGSTSAVWGQNTVNGHLIVVGVTITNATTLGSVTSITDSQSNLYNKAVAGTKSSSLVSVIDEEIWYAANITGGAGSVTVNHSIDNAAVYIREYAGYNTLDATGSAIGSSSSPNTGTVNTNFGAELLIVSTGDDNIGGGQTWTAAGTYGDMVGTATTLTSVSMEDALQNGTAAQTGTLTLGNSSDWVALMATFYQAAGSVTLGYRSLLGVGR